MILNPYAENQPYDAPSLTEEMVRHAEIRLGYRLPPEYLDLLTIRNGGYLRNRCIRVDFPNSWASDHIQVDGVRGIGGSLGIVDDDGLGSAYLIEEWNYPEIGIVIGVMPSGGHDALMFDYRNSHTEPAVVYIDEDRSIHFVSRNLGEFITRLESCDRLNQ